MSIVDSLSGLVARRTSRRGFLTRTALAGSALAVAPGRYLLRPGTAYAAICNCNGSSCDCGSLCCDGYTAFCCEITGANACPPGARLGGWWKVDNSGFCSSSGPSPRYYMDCHTACEPGCGCGPSGICTRDCAGGDCGCHLGCNHRKSGCTRFRYGQCNQQVPCLGPILCRVVTCTPPWLLDPTCTTTPRTDENTRYHHAPCLEADPGNPYGRLEVVALHPDGVRVVGYTRRQGAEVRITAGTIPLGTVVADRTNDQVGRAEVAGAWWFDAVLAVPTGWHSICAAVLESGSALPIGCGAVVIGTGLPFGVLDLAVARPGRVFVGGWVIDPDDVGPVDLHVYADGRFLGSGVANTTRPDVAALYPEYGTAHGFAFEVPAPTGATSVCVYAINVGRGSGNPAIGCARVVVPSGATVGALDFAEPVVDGIRVGGWALDPDTPESVDVHVYVDGTFAGWGQADTLRPDIATLFDGYGPEHGFDLVVPTTPGTHEVCVYAIDRAGGQTNMRIGCRRVVVPARSPFGAVDVLTVGPSELRVGGWAIDPDDDGPVTVAVLVDGSVAVEEPATRDRPDLPQVFPGSGPAHGFDLTATVTPGRHSVTVVARNRGSAGNDTVLRDTVVDVPSGAPLVEAGS